MTAARRIIPALALALLALAAPAQSHERRQGIGRAGVAVKRAASVLSVPVASCPAGEPVQTLTIVNQANARPWALAVVERAIVAQSLQLRAAWGTPCVEFGTGGWLVYLLAGYEPLPSGGYTLEIGGDHYGAGAHGPYWRGQPYAVVLTGEARSRAWSYAISHEIAEMLVDPTDANYFVWANGARQLLEVCDPVENYTYALDGVPVDDFTLPAAWSGGSGPYDEAGRLTAPLAPGYTVGL